MVFRILASAALLASVAQVTLGGVVRVTGSGLGCPDWPLCHGRLIPPMELETLIEYSHRLSASVLAVLVLAAAAVAWRSHRKANGVTVSATMAVVLVMAAAALGGASVLTELAWWVVLIHLGIAEVLVACLAIALVAGWRPVRGSEATGHGSGRVAGRHPPRSGKLGWLVVSCLAGTFILILLGSYMVGLGYGSSCGTWPLCNGSLVPEGRPYMVHMLHRYAAGAVGVLLVWTAASTWAVRAHRPGLMPPSMPAAGLFLVQAAIGAATVWSGFPQALRAVHLSAATLTWLALVLLAALLFAPGRYELRGARDSAGPVMGLQGVAT